MAGYTLHLVIHGRVQGVWFRDSMRREAAQLNITGWVRNRHDGCVEAVVQGETADVEAIVRWAHKGPPAAEVSMVDVTEATGTFTNFEIQY
jgi:acylphosphatase